MRKQIMAALAGGMGVSSSSNSNSSSSSTSSTSTSSVRIPPKVKGKLCSLEEATNEAGFNSKHIVCTHCGLKVFLTGLITLVHLSALCFQLFVSLDTAKLVKKDILLHTIQRRGEGQPDVETLGEHWHIDSKMKFENIGVTRAIGGDTTFKYLACADCDRGPIGIVYNDDPSSFYVAHDRVSFVD